MNTFLMVCIAMCIACVSADPSFVSTTTRNEVHADPFTVSFIDALNEVTEARFVDYASLAEITTLPIQLISGDNYFVEVDTSISAIKDSPLFTVGEDFRIQLVYGASEVENGGRIYVDYDDDCSVTITNPGTSTYDFGSTVPIQWTISGGCASSSPTATIEIRGSTTSSSCSTSSLVDTIATGFTGTSTSFQPSPSVYSETEYQVHVDLTGLPERYGPVVSGCQARSGFYLQYIEDDCELSLDAPVSNEDFETGKQETISWTKAGSCTIDSYDVILTTANGYSSCDGTFRQYIAQDVSGTSTDWLVPVDLTLGSDYAVKIVAKGISENHPQSIETCERTLRIVPRLTDIAVTSHPSLTTLQCGTVEKFVWINTPAVEQSGSTSRHGIRNLTIKASANEDPEGAVLKTIVENVPNDAILFWSIPVGYASYTYIYLHFYPIDVEAGYSTEVTTMKYRTSASTSSGGSGGGSGAGPDVNGENYDANCATKQCWDQNLVGDAFCACARACGRDCVPGYRLMFSGYDPYRDELRGTLLDYTFLRSGDNVYSETGRSYFKPKQVTAQSQNTEDYAGSSTVSSDAESYQRDLSTELDAGAQTGAGAAGSVSSAYKQSISKLAQSDIRIQSVKFSATVLKLSAVSTKPDPNQNFLDSLAEASSNDDYDQIVNLYGSHYFYEITVGVRVSIHNYYESCLFDYMEQEDVEVGLASSSEDEVGGESSSGTTSGRSEGEETKCLRANSESSAYVYGGDTSLLGCTPGAEGLSCSGDLQAYFASKYTNPYYVTAKISPVYNLLDDGGDKTSLKAAFDRYEALAIAESPSVSSTPSKKDCACNLQAAESLSEEEELPVLFIVLAIVGVVVVVIMFIGGYIKTQCAAGGA